MTEKKFDIYWLHTILLRESENDTIQEIEPDTYMQISEFIGKLKREDYDNIEAKIKNALIQITTKMASLLLQIRLDKTIRFDNVDYSNLLDIEKYILDAKEEMHERKEMILSAALNGKSKLIETISKKHKSKTLVVRFLKETEQLVGVDLEKYGPFKAEDVATIPYENAQALISKKIATKIRLDD